VKEPPSSSRVSDLVWGREWERDDRRRKTRRARPKCVEAFSFGWKGQNGQYENTYA
jgi:hypothetical protein